MEIKSCNLISSTGGIPQFILNNNPFSNSSDPTFLTLSSIISDLYQMALHCPDGTKNGNLLNGSMHGIVFQQGTDSGKSGGGFHIFLFFVCFFFSFILIVILFFIQEFMHICQIFLRSLWIWITFCGVNFKAIMTESVNCLNQPDPGIPNVQLLSQFQSVPSKNGEISNRKILLLEM